MESGQLDMNASETTNLKSNGKNTTLVEQVPIEETPFTAVRYEEKWFLTMGKYRLTNELNSLDEVKEEAKDSSWQRIMQIMQIIVDENKAQIATAVLKEVQKDLINYYENKPQ